MPHTLTIVSKSLAPYRVRYYREVARSLADHGWRTILIVAAAAAKDHPWQDPGSADEVLELVEAGGEVDESSLWGRVRRLAGLPADSALPNWRLIRELELSDPDVVWVHEYSPFCLAASLWASFREKVSVLSTDIGDCPPSYACSTRHLIFHRMVSFLFQGVIAQTKDATRRSHPEGVPVILAPHAIDTSEYHPRGGEPQRPFRFLFVGSLDDRKGIRRLVDAGRLVASTGRRFEIRVLGTGPLALWLGRQPDAWLNRGGFVEGQALRDEYRDADAYVLPTNGDTYAVTVHEAAASGLPLIVGRNAGAVETLVDESSGFVIETEDTGELSSHMVRLLDRPDLAKSMGEAARRKAEEFDVRKLAVRTSDFIRGYVGDAGMPPVLERLPQRSDSSRKLDASAVAAVFATMNRGTVAEECLRHLARGVVRPGKVFVTDNASSDDTVVRLTRAADDLGLPLEIIQSPLNLGNAGGIKLAIERAFPAGFGGVWILDDDSWPEPEALDQLLQGEWTPRAVRTSMVLVPDSDEPSWIYETLGTDGDWNGKNPTGGGGNGKWVRVRRSWLGILIPSQVYADTGPVRGELFLRGEDEDYPRRLERMGYQFWMNPSSVLRHPLGGPYTVLAVGKWRLWLERNLGADKLYYRIRNLIWIKRSESGTFAAVVLALAIAFLLFRGFRPLLPALRVFRDAFADAFSNTLGPRKPPAC